MATSANGTLEIDHLVKRYGKVVALSEMTFTVGSGELFGFVGSNGAGKTTTMRIVMGVLAADSGQVRWQGRPLTFRRRRHDRLHARGARPVSQMRVGEQLTYLARLHGMSASAARRAADEWTERLGVAARRDDEVQKLSLGNQQRVQLAAALLHEPELLVLDEPFSGLDPVAVDVMSEVLRERCNAGVPVIFSSHQLDLVERICDRVGIVRGGSMVACGSVDELRAGSPVLAGDRRAADATGRLDRRADRRHGAAPARSRVDPAAGRGRRRSGGAARRAGTGPVREFARELPSLADLFRHVVRTPTTARPMPGSGGQHDRSATRGRPIPALTSTRARRFPLSRRARSSPGPLARVSHQHRDPARRDHRRRRDRSRRPAARSPYRTSGSCPPSRRSRRPSVRWRQPCART